MRRTATILQAAGCSALVVALFGLMWYGRTDRVLSADEKVSLSGTVYAEPFYGPPNYGEDPATDAHEVAMIVRLDHPFQFLAAGDDHATEIREVQLVGDCRAIRQGRGLFAGTLDEAISGHHRRPVLLAIDPASEYAVK